MNEELFEHPWRMMDTPLLIYLWFKMLMMLFKWRWDAPYGSVCDVLPQPKDEYE